MKLTETSKRYIARLEQATLDYAPKLWAITAQKLLRWLSATLRVARKQIELIVIERARASEWLERLAIESIIRNVAKYIVPPSLGGIFNELIGRVGMSYGFLPKDPRLKPMRDYLTRQFIDGYSTFWANLTSPKTLAQRITKLRSQGKSYVEMSRSLANTYKTSFYTAERLIRTSYTVSANYVQLQVLKNAGFTKKRWLSARDNRVRREKEANHKDADGLIVPIDEPFILPSSARLMFPSDSALGAPVGETINCRCTIVGVY